MLTTLKMNCNCGNSSRKPACRQSKGTQHESLKTSNTSNARATVFLVHTGQSDEPDYIGKEHSEGSNTNKTSHAHTTATVDDKRGNFRNTAMNTAAPNHREIHVRIDVSAPHVEVDAAQGPSTVAMPPTQPQ